MTVSIAASLTYTYRRAELVLTSPERDPDSAALARIDGLLAAAATAYRERRYTDAVDAYTRVRGLLWTQLFPLTVLDEAVAWRTALLTPLVSYAAEWLNVLPVEQADGGVRPRETVAVDLPVLGLLSSATGSVQTAALADYELSTRLAAKGNTEAATFFVDRAKANAPDLIEKVSAATVPHRGIGDTRDTPLASPVARLGRIDLASLKIGRLNPGGALIDLTPVTVPPALTVEKRTYAAPVGERVVTLTWPTGSAPATDTVLKIYEARRGLTILPDVLIRPTRPADVAIGLAHAWYYETTLGLAECHHALGSYGQAETWYLRAAGYAYLNAELEAPYVWHRLAACYLEWGNAFFRDDDPASALPIYEKVLGSDGAVPASELYTVPGLTPAADAARTLIGSLGDPTAVAVNPAIAAVVLDVQAQLAKISGGLDFWGHWAQNVPIWTFDYLQSVAVNFTQLAIGAERDAISFWEKADSGELTRTQLSLNVGVSQAELTAVQRQVDAARAESSAYEAARDVARLRARNAQANADEYATKSRQWIMHSALSSQLSGGEDGDASQLNGLADRMTSGSYSLSGDRGTLAAAESLSAARIQREYEIDTMRRQVRELNASVTQADQEVAAAKARVTATQASANAAAVRVGAAKALLQAFDEQRFTPDVWNALGERMSALSQRYLVWALDVAKRMQRAYNFENDVLLHVVRPDYSSDAVHGLLAADSLMADVQSFTFDLVTSTAPKAQPLKQTVSLATRAPFLFESQLRATGTMDFQTDLDDFDSVYPGTYAGRIENVEVAVDGIIPARGVSGTLTNAGISHYRTPSGSGGAVKHRVQPRETQVISDFDPRVDALVHESDRRQRRVFEGAGLASSWTLSFPPEANELDRNTLVDVRLTFTYSARYDPDLRDTVVGELASRPSIHERQRPFPLRWLFADAFFAFYGSGVLELELGRGDFAATETRPVLTELGLVCAATPHDRVGGIVLRVTAPGAAPVAVTTTADGVVDSADLAGAVTGQSALGAYRIELTAADNPGWVTGGALDLDPIDNIALVVGYSFTPRS